MISIIIIVKNDPKIVETVHSLQKIRFPESYEIIIVYGSPIDHIKIKDKRIHIIEYNSSNKNKITIPEQRNAGVRKAEGDIIVFIDASCIPHNNWLENLVYPITHEKESIVAGQTYSINPSSFRKNLQRTHSMYLSEAPTINLAIKKEVFNTIGLFDEEFEYGSDVDLTWRAIKNGYKIRFEPKAQMTHDWGNFKDELKRAYRYGKARVKLYKKHKEKRDTIIKKDFVTILYPALVILMPFSLILPVLFVLPILLIIKNKYNKPLKTVTYNYFYGFGILHALLFN